MRRSKLKGLVVTIGLTALIVLGVACGNGEASTIDKGSPDALTAAASVQPSEPAPPPASVVDAPGKSAPNPAPEVVASSEPAVSSGLPIVPPGEPDRGPEPLFLPGEPVTPPPTGGIKSLPPVPPSPIGVTSGPAPAVGVQVETGVIPAVATSNGPAPNPAPVVVARPMPESVPSIAVEPSMPPVTSARGVYSPLLQSTNSQVGIWVTGQGSITSEPDLALLNIGIEANAKTVVEARDQAARAMDAIVAALASHEVEDRDIQTRFFNISPRYEYPEVLESGVRIRRQVLVGYNVNNSAVVKIRDLDTVGTIIDDVATAGGDATRINGISFTIEDPRPLMTQLREQAVQNALTTAQQFADLTDITLGRLVFISESRGGAPVVSDFGQEAFMSKSLAAPAPMTSISGGSLEISMTVQAVFDIQ